MLLRSPLPRTAGAAHANPGIAAAKPFKTIRKTKVFTMTAGHSKSVCFIRVSVISQFNRCAEMTEYQVLHDMGANDRRRRKIQNFREKSEKSSDKSEKPSDGGESRRKIEREERKNEQRRRRPAKNRARAAEDQKTAAKNRATAANTKGRNLENGKN